MKTINKTGFYAFEEKRSKFLAFSFPVADKEIANASLEKLKTEYNDARHVVYAYRILENNLIVTKAFDAEEPKNTAGRPILHILERLDIVDTIVIVVRYFGGIKLGSGGLIRAYSKAAHEVLKISDIVEFEETVSLSITADYSAAKTIEYLVEKYGAKNIEKKFLTKLNFNVVVKSRLCSEFLSELKKHGITVNE